MPYWFLNKETGEAQKIKNAKRGEIGFMILEHITNKTFHQQSNYIFKSHRYYKFPQSYIGLQSVCDDTGFDVDAISSVEEMNQYDYVLISITSHQDIETIIKHFPKKEKRGNIIIVGGSGIINPVVLYNFVDIIVLGRCDNQINNIINGKYSDNVIDTKKDKYYEGKYSIGMAKKQININHGGKNILFNESSYGCKFKCFFCHYGWANKYVDFKKENSYKSGYNGNEDIFKNMIWKKTRYQVSAIDGISEISRRRANKKLTKNEIINKLLDRDNAGFLQNSLQLKLYNIVGYSWENDTDNYYSEIEEILKYVDSKLNGKITILLNNTHFIPMPLTPFESLPLNMIDFKKIDYSFNGKKIKLIKSYAGYGIKSQRKNLISYRLKFEDLQRFEKEINNPSTYFDKYLLRNENILPNIIRTHKYKLF